MWEQVEIAMPDAIDFIGRYDHALDAKNRLMVPQAFRDAVRKAEKELTFYLTRGFDRCLAMYAKSSWDAMVALLKSRKAEELAHMKTRKFFRLFYSSAVALKPDKAGRILVPEHLKSLAALEKHVVLIGVNDPVSYTHLTLPTN